jgi:hypothetical protein
VLVKSVWPFIALMYGVLFLYMFFPPMSRGYHTSSAIEQTS